MFNGKRFSYAAAYDQSSIQIRSAGSFMLGLMWFQTSIDYARPLNALLIQILDGVGRIKLHEGSIGLGYAYNGVPMKNLLINITAMPMLVVYNRTKAYLYESNYDIYHPSQSMASFPSTSMPALRLPTISTVSS
jgi:hypothetical protein